MADFVCFVTHRHYSFYETVIIQGSLIRVSLMTLEERMLYVALTRHNYFPNQKSSVGELPPCISTRQFTPEISDRLGSLDDKRKGGYDVVTYFSTRYNNVARELSLIHPRAYCRLAKHIVANWSSISHVKENENSFIKPEIHHDGRILVMNYEDPIEKTNRNLSNGFGKRFIVNADISNCFSSIYTHAIPWAIVGFDKAKENSKSKDQELWYNQLDKYYRHCKRNETQGIPIGSATSNIALEIILGKVDKKLRDSGFLFSRYVDDYTCHCETNEDAHKFLLILGQELRTYKLSLNTLKTKITELPYPEQDSWILELLTCLPSRLGRAHEEEPKLTTSEAVTFINKAILINRKTSDGSVLKYAIQLIISHLNDDAPLSAYRIILNLSWHYPILIPYLDLLIDKAEFDNTEIEPCLTKLIKENCILKRSDGICWPLHIMKKNGIIPSDEIVRLVLGSKDCVALAILNSMLEHDSIVEFAHEIVSTEDTYYIDTYWLLLYQLYRENKIDNVHDNAEAFKILKDNNVDFIPGDVITAAERESDAIEMKIIFKDFAIEGAEHLSMFLGE